MRNNKKILSFLLVIVFSYLLSSHAYSEESIFSEECNVQSHEPVEILQAETEQDVFLFLLKNVPIGLAFTYGSAFAHELGHAIIFRIASGTWRVIHPTGTALALWYAAAHFIDKYRLATYERPRTTSLTRS